VLGVVSGDIGTGPLYAFRVCFGLAADLEVTRANVLGLLPLIVWALLLVISLEYATIMLRADNRGERGVLAPLVLVPSGRTALPHVPALRNEVREQGLEYPPDETSFIVARENVIVTRASGMAPWRKRLYSLMLRNAQFAGHHYAVPAARMIDIGEVLEI